MAITSISSLNSILVELPANTAASPYTLVLKVSDLGYNPGQNNDVSAAIDNSGKYVYLDCSGSTFTSMDSPFYRCTGLTGIIMPDSVTLIYGNFQHCTNLKNVAIGKNVTTIGGDTGSASVFRGCISLTDIFVDSMNPAFCSENGILYYKAKTVLLAYPAGKTDSVFTIPNGVTSISTSAFEGCSNLTSVVIAPGVNTIWSTAFWNCTSLTTVTIPSSVNKISIMAFTGCTSLAHVTFGGTIPSDDFYTSEFNSSSVFPGDLRDKFYAADASNGTPGTYATIRSAGDDRTAKWIKQ